MHEVAEASARVRWRSVSAKPPVARAGGRGARELAAVRELASADPSLAPLSQLLADRTSPRSSQAARRALATSPA